MKHIRLTIAYELDNERTVEVYKCQTREEAQYQIDLTKQLTPSHFTYSARWVQAEA
jgi:hypothetical protein